MVSKASFTLCRFHTKCFAMKQHSVDTPVFSYAIVFIQCRIGKWLSVDSRPKQNIFIPFSYENGLVYKACTRNLVRGLLYRSWTDS